MLSRAEPRTTRAQGWDLAAWGRRSALALGASWAMLALEAVVVTWWARARVTSIWELQYGILGLSPAWLLLGAAGGLLGAFYVGLVQAESRKAQLALAVAVALPSGGLSWGVGGGRHLSDLTSRLGFATLMAVIAAGAAYVLSPSLRRGLSWVARGSRERAIWSGALAVGVVGISLLNQLVLVRLYPAFHLGLTGISLICCAFIAAPFENYLKGKERTWSLVATAVVVLAGTALLPGARTVRGFDNLRLLLLDGGPSLRWGVLLAARLAPPPPNRCLEQDCDEVTSLVAATEATSDGNALDWTGRDILLVTVDALRADRLGAYGSARPLTPALDALAREGVVFEAAYAATPHTSYSITSLMTGKYMRPLLLQGAGEDSDTWAALLRTYGFRTAAFYPPAVFFIDTPRFRGFEDSRLGFEYSKVEFAEGEARLGQVRSYLAEQSADRPVFVWLHLFGPHEPYEVHPEFHFGDRDVDRYDSEVAFADRTVGETVRLLRSRNPNAVVIISADHGEEFGEHGGRYHGTTVYEEQVRVPLIVVAPGSVPAGGRVAQPVQTIDVLPTVLAALSIPRPAPLRGRNLVPLLVKAGGPTELAEDEGLALAETEDHTLLAEGTFRLVCERRIGACQLFDLATDPKQQKDVAAQHPERFERMRARSQNLAASHGQFEARGLRAEGRGWPAPILRAISGDGDAALDLSELLDDADVTIRRKAAELLFELKHQDTAPSLRLSLTRDEDPLVRRWSALALTRLGQGAPLVYELVQDGELPFRRLAALALAESGDFRGEKVLVNWWNDSQARDFERSRQLLQAFAEIRSKDAVGPLVRSLKDVRLRPEIAATLAAIGDKDARGFLLRALAEERYQNARSALLDAIVALGGKNELIVPLVRFLGVPDPLEDGLFAAERAGILHHVGGPKADQLRRVRSLANSGVVAHLNVPVGGNGQGVRLLVRASVQGSEAGRIYLQKGTEPPPNNSKDGRVRFRYRPTIDREDALELVLNPRGEGPSQYVATLPPAWRARPGHPFPLALFADQSVQVHALALVPLADELPPPEPEPWEPP